MYEGCPKNSMTETISITFLMSAIQKDNSATKVFFIGTMQAALRPAADGNMQVSLVDSRALLISVYCPTFADT